MASLETTLEKTNTKLKILSIFVGDAKKMHARKHTANMEPLKRDYFNIGVAFSKLLFAGDM